MDILLIIIGLLQGITHSEARGTVANALKDTGCN